MLAFRAGRRLTEELPADQVPTLVFAGRVGWMIADLLDALRNSRHLDGKIRIVSDADDMTLASLYRGARFTIFPSLYEGWGLPVTESLGYGKVCIASSSTSIPEAGGDFCLYHDPDNVTEAFELYRKAITEPEIIGGARTQDRSGSTARRNGANAPRRCWRLSTQQPHRHRSRRSAPDEATPEAAARRFGRGRREQRLDGHPAAA